MNPHETSGNSGTGHYREVAWMRHDPAMDQAITQPDVQSPALAEPTQHVRIRWILGLTLASLGMWMANQTPLQVMLEIGRAHV